MNIQEDYVSFETAKLLKEKGFDEGCSFVINAISKGVMPVSYPTTNSDIEDEKVSLVALPTLQMAMKWLREEKRTSIIIEFDLTRRGYNPYVYQPDYDMDWVIKWRRNLPMKYEEAVEAALKYTLENLI